MNNPALQQIETPLAEVSRGWLGRVHESMHDRSDDREAGVIALGLAVKLAGVGLAVTVPLGLGVIDSFRHNVKVETDLTVSAGKGEVTKEFVMNAIECHGGNVSHISGVEANYQKKIDALVWTSPSIYGVSAEFNGHLTTLFCNTGISGTLIIDRQTHHVRAVIPSDAMTTIVYRTDPREKVFKSGNDLGAGFINAFENDVKSIPFTSLNPNIGDSTQARVEGMAELEADNVATKSCGVVSYPDLKLAIANEIADDIVKQSNNYTDYTITRADVEVDMPETISGDNQYTPLVQNLDTYSKQNGITLTLPTQKAVCTPLNAGQGLTSPVGASVPGAGGTS